MSTVDNTKLNLRFGECTLAILEKKFQVKQKLTLPALESWVSGQAEVSDLERQILSILRSNLIANVHDWNEQELSLHFIGPVFSFVNFTTDQFNLFAERSLAGVVDDIELRGEPDGMIASGMREPEMPYFCFQEYKKFKNPEGDAAGQCLAAMLVAQAMNQTNQPIYGCFVIGHDWYFMALQGREYAISIPFVAVREDIFDIFRILRVLKQIITELMG